VATHALVQKSLNVAEEMGREGVEIEVLDPRTINPLDREAILNSVKKTGKLITADEGCVTGGFGSEVAAIVADEVFGYLEAPIIRVGSPNTPVPFSPPLEEFYIPDEGSIKEAVNRILAYQ
jgi:pyruvate dehydrogenase E1 component beta subunit